MKKNVQLGILLAVAVLPLFLASFGALGYVHAQELTFLERRIAAVEIDMVREQERLIAGLARIEVMEERWKYLDAAIWKLFWAVIGGSVLTGAVTADRVVYRWKNKERKVIV